jgi:formate/nitrite transporter FocA (FNT family)
MGNIVGGAVFVGGVYWYVYDTKKREKVCGALK